MTGKTIGDLNGPWKILFKVSQVAAPLALTLAIVLGGYLVNIDNRLVAVEASRFTARDGLALRTWIDKRLKEDVPPPEVLIRLARIEQDIKEIQRKLDSAIRTKGGP